MKKLIWLVFVFISCKVFSQHPIGTDSLQLQTVANSITLFKSKGVIGSDSGLIIAVYGDTSVANLGKLKNYPGAEIRVGDSVWLRNSTATEWLNQSREGSGTGGGGTESWQDALIIGSTLTQPNTVDGGGFAFSWNNMKHYFNKAVDGVVLPDAKLNVGVGTSEYGFKITSSRNNAHFDMFDDPTPGNGGLDAINIKSINKDGNEIFWLSGRWLQLFKTGFPTTIDAGSINISTDATLATGTSISPNTIQSNNADLLFKYKSSSPIETFRVKSTGQVQGSLFYSNSDPTAYLTADASGNFILSPVTGGGSGTAIDYSWHDLTNGSTITVDGTDYAINFDIVLTGNATLDPINIVEGLWYTVEVTQDGTGSRTLDVPAGSLIKSGSGSGTSLTLQTAANALDKVYFQLHGATITFIVDQFQ